MHGKSLSERIKIRGTGTKNENVHQSIYWSTLKTLQMKEEQQEPAD